MLRTMINTTDYDSMCVDFTVIKPYVLVRPFLLYIGRAQMIQTATEDQDKDLVQQ